MYEQTLNTDVYDYPSSISPSPSLHIPKWTDLFRLGFHLYLRQDLVGRPHPPMLISQSGKFVDEDVNEDCLPPLQTSV
jgi:hypothetical protein